MKKLKMLLKIIGVALFLSIIGLLLPVFLQSLHIVSRLWIRNIFYWSSGILVMIFTLILIIICILHFMKRELKRFVILAITVAFLPIAFGVGTYSFVMIVSESTKEWVVEEGGQKWIYEKEPQDPWGGAPFYDVKYKYINWFVRGNEELNSLELM